MSKNIAEPTPDRRVSNIDYRTRQVERRPVPNTARFNADRAIEYFWGGHKWNWMSSAPGSTILDNFDNVTRDLTVDFGAYIHNGTGADGQEFFIGAPLGPRWSCWHLDVCHARGPDYGILDIEVATAPFFRRAQGVNDTEPGSSLNRFDIPSPLGLSSDYDFEWFDPGSAWSMNGYNATEIYNSYSSELGTTLRITGEYGAMLTNPDTGLDEPITGQSFDSGDGLMYFFRFFINGKHASSTGFKFKMQALRLSRAVELDGTLI